MNDVVQKNVTPHKGVLIDLSEVYINELYAVFIKNWTTKQTANPRMDRGEGSNEAVWTPLQSSARYSALQLPAGQNYCVGFFHSAANSKGYVFGWNEFSKHFVYRIGTDGVCTMVYVNACLGFELDPETFIRDGRVHTETNCFFDPVLKRNVDRTFIVFTNSRGEIKMICEEDSILTDSFNAVKYPNLQADQVSKQCSFIQLGMDTPFYCPTFETIANVDTDVNIQNHLLYKSLQFRYRFIDVWGRRSEWSPISDQFVSAIGGACINESSGLPRCLKLALHGGAPFVERIEIAFRRCQGNLRGMPTAADWYLYDTIEKYNTYDALHWWERAVNPDFVFDQTTGLGWDKANNFIYYKFCGNKECQPIDVNETNRLQNPIPKSSATVFGIGKGIGAGRNRRNYEPLSPKELNKVNFTVEAPQGESCNLTGQRKITVWGVIYSPYEDQPVMIRSSGNRNVFGMADCSKNNPFAYGQVFPEGQAGFIACLYGTKHYCVSKQYRLDLFTGEKLEVGTDFWQGISVSAINILRYKPLQKWEFEVLPGKYVFHVCSHQAKPTDPYYWKTSTYMKGRTPLTSIGDLVAGEERELIIGACDQDVEIYDTPVMIYDLTRSGKGCAVVDASSVNAGYLLEDEKEGRPIEKARVMPNTVNGLFGGETFWSEYTDRNGFYFATNRGRGFQTALYGYINGQPNKVLARSRTSYDNSEAWYRFDKLPVYKGEVRYPKADRYIIKGKVLICQSSIGIAGALVVLSNGQFANTDANGEFRLYAHDNGWTTVPRADKLIVSQKGTCHLLTCEAGCNYCFDDRTTEAPPYTGSERFYNLFPIRVNIRGLNKKGPKNGGRYGIAIGRHYTASRASYVDMLDKHYLDIPSLTETKKFDFSKLKFAIDPSFNAGRDVEKISFYITDNLNWDNDLYWTAERIQYVDSTGNENTAAPTQVRLYYEGLAEYNKQHNFSTTTVMDFIAGEQAIEGDQVEFVINGNGEWFEKKIVSLVRYDKLGKYIQVDYTDDLKDLKDGALIHIIRPKQCEQKEWFYEICPAIKVTDGIPEQLSGYLNYYDSYFTSRAIPVPVVVIKKGLDNAGKEIETSAVENKLMSYPYLYEHHSPSDFWGDHCFPRGRINIKNPFQKESCNRMEVALSKTTSERSDFNGLGYFDTEDITDFQVSDLGGINLIFVEVNAVMVICENGVFTVGYNDNRIRMGQDGSLENVSLPNRMGKPQNIDGYGCDLRDVNTICRIKGLVAFFDRNAPAIVFHDWAKCKNVAEGVFMSWLEPKTKFVCRYNEVANNIKYFHACIDLKTGEYLFSDAYVKQVATNYINVANDWDVLQNETIVIDIMTQQVNGTRSFTPEYYGAISRQGEAQLLSFQFGNAWGHYGLSKDFDSFFGVPTRRVFEFVAGSKNKDDVYKFLWMEVYCKEHGFNADRIVTQAGQISRLMRSWFERRNKFTTGDFKGAVNTFTDPNLAVHLTTNVLLEGEPLFGQFIKVRLINEDSSIGKYAELNSVSVYMFTEKENSNQ
jgi:hypothetical protein